jgi:hypothetical protein
MTVDWPAELVEHPRTAPVTVGDVTPSPEAVNRGLVAAVSSHADLQAGPVLAWLFVWFRHALEARGRLHGTATAWVAGGGVRARWRDEAQRLVAGAGPSRVSKASPRVPKYWVGTTQRRDDTFGCLWLQGKGALIARGLRVRMGINTGAGGVASAASFRRLLRASMFSGAQLRLASCLGQRCPAALGFRFSSPPPAHRLRHRRAGRHLPARPHRPCGENHDTDALGLLVLCRCVRSLGPAS